MTIFPQRVLMTADTVGGVWTYAMELIRALGKRGVTVGLATMGAPLSLSQRAEIGSLPNAEVFESSYKLEWMNEPWDDVHAAGDWLLKIEDAFRPDIVHLNNFPHGALSWRTPKIVVGHSCVLSWWRAVKGCDVPREWDMYRRMVTDGLALADLVVAPSHAMLAALTEHYGPFAATAVIANGRRCATAKAGPKLDLILAAGRLWDDAKNILALAQAAPRLPWPVCIAGDNRHPDGRETRQFQVRHLGQLSSDELQVWFERAAIYAAPARYEPFGLSVLEAALAGCALVLADIPSLRGNWNDAAVFVAPDDAHALEAALRKLIANPTLRVELAAKAQRVAGRFTPEKMADGYLRAYQRAAEVFRDRNEGRVSQPGSQPADHSKGASCEL